MTFPDKHQNSLLDLKDLELDFVIMICGNDYNACPIVFGGKNYFKKSLKDIYPFRGTKKEKIGLLREIRDEIGDWIQDFHYYMSGEASILTITDCCDVIGADEEICCDIGESNGDCCSPTDSAKDNESY